MHQQYLPQLHVPRYSYVLRDLRQMTFPREILWCSLWSHRYIIILASLMVLFTVTIINFEIANLATDPSNDLSNAVSTGAGI